MRAVLFRSSLRRVGSLGGALFLSARFLRVVSWGGAFVSSGGVVFSRPIPSARGGIASCGAFRPSVRPSGPSCVSGLFASRRSSRCHPSRGTSRVPPSCSLRRQSCLVRHRSSDEGVSVGIGVGVSLKR